VLIHHQLVSLTVNHPGGEEGEEGEEGVGVRVWGGGVRVGVEEEEEEVVVSVLVLVLVSVDLVLVQLQVVHHQDHVGRRTHQECRFIGRGHRDGWWRRRRRRRRTISLVLRRPLPLLLPPWLRFSKPPNKASDDASQLDQVSTRKMRRMMMRVTGGVVSYPSLPVHHPPRTMYYSKVLDERS
jgi:hypothetical protein